MDRIFLIFETCSRKIILFFFVCLFICLLFIPGLPWHLKIQESMTQPTHQYFLFSVNFFPLQKYLIKVIIYWASVMYEIFCTHSHYPKSLNVYNLWMPCIMVAKVYALQNLGTVTFSHQNLLLFFPSSCFGKTQFPFLSLETPTWEILIHHIFYE